MQQIIIIAAFLNHNIKTKWRELSSGMNHMKGIEVWFTHKNAGVETHCNISNHKVIKNPVSKV